MWLENVEINNFRSIESMAMDFGPGVNAVFGENGTGKSNLIRAVLRLLGPTYPGAHSFSVSDHLRSDEANEIRIVLTFNQNGTRTSLNWEPDAQGNYRLYLDGRGVKDEERKKYCPLYFPANREVRELPGQNTWNPIGRILAEMTEIIRADDVVMKAFDSKADELNKVLEQSATYSQFKGKLRTFAAEHLGRTGATLDLQLSLIDLEYALRTLQIFEVQDGKPYNATASGMGVQSGIVMAALRAFAEVSGGRFIVIAEEPEAYLHPLSQQALLRVFEGIANLGTQVLVTTHSPHFISVESLEGLHKVWMNNSLTQVMKYSYSRHLKLLNNLGVTSATMASLQAKLGHHLSVEAREGLFAKTVVLCEGESEAGSLGVWAGMLGHDFPTEGISVVPSHGKFSLPVLALFYKALDIPTFLVYDSDSKKEGQDRAKHADANRLLLKMCTAPEEDFPATGVFNNYAVFAPDFERVVRDADPNYATKESSVNDECGLRPDGGKGIRARYTALEYKNAGLTVPQPITTLIEGIERYHLSTNFPGSSTEKGGKSSDKLTEAKPKGAAPPRPNGGVRPVWGGA
jgi:putative ATP-dependent endonuclease of OLD family